MVGFSQKELPKRQEMEVASPLTSGYGREHRKLLLSKVLCWSEQSESLSRCSGRTLTSITVSGTHVSPGLARRCARRSPDPCLVFLPWEEEAVLHKG